MRLQVKGFINFGFWFLKILASAGIFLLYALAKASNIMQDANG